MMYFAGIGSRETPEDQRPRIHRLVAQLIPAGYVCRSGGARGADSMFHEACVALVTGFDPVPYINHRPKHVTQAALDLAARYHPNWEAVLRKPGAAALMARNGYQVLGEDLASPVERVFCWTQGGELVGGTAQAMRIAIDYKIPITNLATTDDGALNTVLAAMLSKTSKTYLSVDARIVP